MAQRNVAREGCTIQCFAPPVLQSGYRTKLLATNEHFLTAHRVKFTDVLHKCTSVYEHCSTVRKTKKKKKKTGSKKILSSSSWVVQSTKKHSSKIGSSKFIVNRVGCQLCGHRCFLFRNTVADNPQNTKILNKYLVHTLILQHRIRFLSQLPNLTARTDHISLRM